MSYKVKLAFDFDENEWIAFVDKLPRISGYGPTEKEAILDLLHQAKNEKGFNHIAVRDLIEKITNETEL